MCPESVFFFYYTVAKGELEGESVIYEWNEEIEKFLSNRGADIAPCSIEEIPSEFKDGVMRFEKFDNEGKAEALIRHLRNAFAHYRIGENDDSFKMEDFNKQNQRTMIGKIRGDDLKQLCYLLLKQGEKYNENRNIL